MTDYTSNIGSVLYSSEDSSSANPAWYVFDSDTTNRNSAWYAKRNEFPQYIGFSFNNIVRVCSITILQATSGMSIYTSHFKDVQVTIEASTSGVFDDAIILDTITLHGGSSCLENAKYSFTNKNAYKAYRLKFSNYNYTTSDSYKICVLGEIQFYGRQ